MTVRQVTQTILYSPEREADGIYGNCLQAAVAARTTTIPDRLCIVGGKSPRGVPHVCVAEHGEIVWDPHPSRDGLVTITDATWFVEHEPYMKWTRWASTQRRDESAEVKAESAASGGSAPVSVPSQEETRRD